MNKKTLQTIKNDLERSQTRLNKMKEELGQLSPAPMQKTIDIDRAITISIAENNSSNQLLLYNNEFPAHNHRDSVGGMWDEIGKLQLNFMVDRGLKPDMKLIDIGCGCLRAGVHFISYLNDGNYYGIDMSSALINAGYQKELDVSGRKKTPKNNFLVNSHFESYRFGVEFDFAVAQSVFTHLPLNQIRRCLFELAKCVKEGGHFYATFFECSPELLYTFITQQPGEIITSMDSDPYHYQLQDFLWCIEGLPWEISYIGDWQHPRGQKMLCFTKIIVRGDSR
ncbi:MAG: class I SAM-dependent methyltransferase [Microcoleus sp. PH2017_40_RAT_O_B]|jgi:2-polyprenyl-3-methyl-5-hydroxy-6-metoxy-1,4-benzoquinol methylase|uniref:class I SAM-dependent methyltransferase n=1 Tax=unclassified Microcoleus TaxID=2642155 RepID=UPI001DAB4E8F|nr:MULTISPECIES: class I SAM-dependent methyltransferase [unclassified Microcoleus]MCC3571018.1 class I SAM-dependent methyltransferase [Microcoleus sp. PH2017_34_RAT_O_A]MCC3608603.1 class I SAM-dependent methyltransferase [Microcoleus sp. PH2017_40_RAT_O_B]